MGGPRDLPTGTVTFLFSDIQGSTRLVQNLGDRYVAVLDAQQSLLRTAFAAHGGIELGTEGDSFFVVFADAVEAVAAAIDAQQAVASHPWPDDARVRVRMGIHTGQGTLGGANYVGIDVHRAARIAGAAHGGQVLISESTRALAGSGLGAGELRDLGEHRLKDLLQPERIYQVLHPGLEDDFPPLATLTSRPNNLPTQTSEFLGREAELDAISKLLEAGARLITLIGPGGIGKTRLSLQTAAGCMEQFKDGLYFVDLSATRDAEQAFDAIVRALGLQGAGDQRPLDVLKEQLASRKMLLILDNLEQVITAAEGVADLLQRAPELRVLVTSREALRVRGERVFPVPALSLPTSGPGRLSAADAASSEAVRLFVERAAQTRGSFELTDENASTVAGICARLDGLPLAIELAAARLTLFSPEELLDRLRESLQVVGGGARDLPARQQTLRSTIQWSYELLDGHERIVFQVLSVFSSARVAAVEQVGTRIETLRDVPMLDLLGSLVDKSLVRSTNGSGPQRLTMLGTIHDYAFERLLEDPGLADAARRAHAEYFSEFVRTRQSALTGSNRDAALTELDGEIGNLLTAWRFWVDAGDLAKLDELLEGLWPLHEARGWYASATELARDLLAVLSSVPSTPERLQQKTALAVGLARGLMAIRGYTKEVEEAFNRVRVLLQEAGDLPQLYPVLRGLWTERLYRADFVGGLEIAWQVLDLAERSGDVDLLIDANLVVGANLGSIGRIQESFPYIERVFTLFDPRRPATGGLLRLGPNPGVVAHTTAAFIFWLLGEPDRSIDHTNSAVAAAVQLNHPYTLAYALFHSGFADLWRRDYESVLDRSRRARTVAEEHGYRVWEAVANILHGTALAALGKPDEGMEMSDRGITLYQELTAPPVFWPFVLSIRARGFLFAGRPAEALENVDLAIAIMQGHIDMLFSDGAVLKADLLLALGRNDEAEQWFERGLEIGRTTGARITELRAATRLARMRSEAMETLRSIYESFAGASETADLAEARAVLEGAERA